MNIIDYEPTTTLNSKISTKYHTMYRPQEEILISTCNFMNILGFYQFDYFLRCKLHTKLGMATIFRMDHKFLFSEKFVAGNF